MQDLTENEIVLLGINNADVNKDDVEIIDDDDIDEITIDGVKKRIYRRKAKRNVIKKELGASKRRMQAIERVGTLPKEMQKKLINGKLQLSDKTLYSVMELAQLKDGKLIKTDAGTAVGERNISQGKYDHQFLLQEIVILYDDSSANGTFDNDLAPEILNGELSILNNSRNQIENMPVTAIASVNGYPIENRYNSYHLDNPKWFDAKTDIQVRLATSGTIANGFVKILLIGTEIRPL